MIFVRVIRDAQTGEVLSVATGDGLLNDDSGIYPDGRAVVVEDFGMYKKKCRAHVLHEKLQAGEALDCWTTPVTYDGIKAAIRAGGVQAIPAPVRAWLAATLPDHQVRELGIGQGVPLSALLCAWRLRERRDPDGGHRVAQIERMVQEQSDIRSAAALRRRLTKTQAKQQTNPTEP